MKPVKKDKTGKVLKEKGGFLSLSMIIPDPSDEKGLSCFFDSILKIKKPYEKDYEILILSPSPEETAGQLSKRPEVNNLLQKKVIRVIPVDPAGPAPVVMATGIREASKQNILILETGLLERSFSMDACFSLKQETIQEAQVIFPTFHENTGPGGKVQWPIVLLDSSLARYLFLEADLSSKDYKADMDRVLRRLNLASGEFNISQKSPFREIRESKQNFLARLGSGVRFFIHWYFVLPAREFKTKPHLRYEFISSPSYLRMIFVSVATALFIIMPVMSYNSGISGDEQGYHYKHGQNVYNYFATLGKDSSALHYDNSVLHLYGPAFDLFTVIVIKVFNVEKVFEVRHMINAWSGWLAILITGLLATMLAGWRAGVMALIFMFLSPRFLGHSFNNPKDIPFAMATIMTLYFMIRFLKEFPKPRWGTVLLTGLGIGMAIGVRVGGLLLIAYLFLFSGIYFLVTERIRNLFAGENMQRLGRLLLYLILISLIGYVLGILTWPYALQSPISNPLKAMDVMTNYATSIRQLFEGQIIWSNRAPWYYVPKYIVITIPLVVLSGVALFFLLIPKMERKLNYLWVFIIAFTFLFPVIYIIDKESNVYGGWRHSMFIYPSIVIAACIGFATLLRLTGNRYLRYGVVVFIAGLSLLPLRHIIFNHPYEYIYYNELTGGTNGALGKYEMDYYYHSIKNGAEWLIENRIKNSDAGPDNKIIVASNFTISYFFRNYMDRVETKYVRYYDRGKTDWDYAIIANSYISPYQLLNGLFPPANAIHTIKVDKCPICTVIERKSKLDYEGIALLSQRNYMQAIPLLEQAVELEPWNEIALLSLASAYIETRQQDRAQEIIAKCLQVYPDYDKALNLLGVSYLQQGKLSEAFSVFTRITQINEKFVSAYHNLGLICIRQNNLDLALRYFHEAIQYQKNFKPSYLAIGEVLRSQGKIDEARQYFEIANAL